MKLKLNFYKTNDENIPKVDKWMTFHGGYLCVLDAKMTLTRLVDGRDMTKDLIGQSPIYNKLMLLLQKETLNDDNYVHFYTYLDPKSDVVFGKGDREILAYVGSYNKTTSTYSFLIDDHVFMLGEQEQEQEREQERENSHMQIGYSSEINDFVVVLSDEKVLLNMLVRGDGPLFKRYFQIRMNKEHRRHLYKMFSEDRKTIDTFEDIENTIYDFAVYLYRSYIARFVKRENIRLKNSEYIFLEACHKEYKMKRDAGEREKITVEKVLDKLNSISADNLYYLVNDFNMKGSEPVPPPASKKPPHRLIQANPAFTSKKKDHVPS